MSSGILPSMPWTVLLVESDGVLDAVPPEAGEVVAAVVHPLDADPLVDGDGRRSAVGILVVVGPVAGAAVLVAGVGADAEEVPLARMVLRRQARLASGAGAAAGREGPVRVRHRRARQLVEADEHAAEVEVGGHGEDLLQGEMRGAGAGEHDVDRAGAAGGLRRAQGDGRAAAVVAERPVAGVERGLLEAVAEERAPRCCSASRRRRCCDRCCTRGRRRRVRRPRRQRPRAKRNRRWGEPSATDASDGGVVTDASLVDAASDLPSPSSSSELEQATTSAAAPPRPSATTTPPSTTAFPSARSMVASYPRATSPCAERFFPVSGPVSPLPS